MDRALDPGIVEEDIDLTSGSFRARDEAFNRALIRDVAFNRDEFSWAIEFVAEAHQSRLVPVDGDDARAARNHQLDRRRADLSSRASYQGYFPVEAIAVEHSCCRSHVAAETASNNETLTRLKCR